jgi:SNF2 family DNA or RNA helicase
MGIFDRIIKLKDKSKHKYDWSYDKTFVLKPDPVAIKDLDKAATTDIWFGVKLAQLRSLAEEGLCDEVNDEFIFEPESISRLDDDLIELLNLPPRIDPKFLFTFKNNTSSKNFTSNLKIQLADGTLLTHYTREGPILSFSQKERYTLSAPQLSAIIAYELHCATPNEERHSFVNNKFVHHLQTAQKDGLKTDLSHFKNLEIISPESVSVSAELCENGDMLLSPSYGGGVNIEDVNSRLGQIALFEKEGVMKVKDKFILLDKKKLDATYEILSNRRIPKEQVATFLQCPSAYIDASLVDLDLGFSLRAEGAEYLTHKYFGVLEDIDSSWFNKLTQEVFPLKYVNATINERSELSEFRESLNAAISSGANIVTHQGVNYLIPDTTETENLVEKITDRVLVTEAEKKENEDESIRDDNSDHGDERITLDPEPKINNNPIVVSTFDNENGSKGFFGNSIDCSALEFSSIKFDTSNLKRSPFPHQTEGIQWLLAHLKASQESSAHDAGALLADDMGLGKTYMSLVGIAERYQIRESQNKPKRPCLIVAPLSLLENWVDEISETFVKSPFTDTVILQSDADLDRFRIEGSNRETSLTEEDRKRLTDVDKNTLFASIKQGLKIGSKHTVNRLDMPGRLVLTTYQTLRDYQFSLSHVDWEVVAFDEGQNLKNPNAMSTIAARALKASFKLLASATPVENSLKELWSLMDVCSPGVLGIWDHFHHEYIKPISEVPKPNPDKFPFTSGPYKGLEIPEAIEHYKEKLELVKNEIGNELKDHIGTYMLRRTKAQKLKGLPTKRIFTGDSQSKLGIYRPELAQLMEGVQLDCYQDLIDNVNSAHRTEKAKVVLSALNGMRIASIHPALHLKLPIPSDAKKLKKEASLSAKIKSLIWILDEIHKRNEKVIVFANSRDVQNYAAALVAAIYQFRPDIINGATKAVSKKSSVMTRKRIISRFQSEPGFGVIIMSPIAAGVGLTVTQANNVIHLERLWNPAKENQATDRVYRIGQTADVSVYLPYALHPERKSFDLLLGEVIESKMVLFDSIFTVQTIDPSSLKVA